MRRINRLWLRHVHAFATTTTREVYWFLISSGFRTYRFLPIFFLGAVFALSFVFSLGQSTALLAAPGVYLGATLTSETTAAITGAVGVASKAESFSSVLEKIRQAAGGEVRGKRVAVVALAVSFAGDRVVLARAITLIESKRADHQNKAHQLVQELLPDTGKAIRVGITGAPGVGKSLTIDTLGTYLTGKGHRVAVLAVDPSSTRTGGSRQA